MAEIQRRQIKESFGSRAFDVVNIIILALLSLVCLYPVWYVLVASVRASGEKGTRMIP